MKTDEPSGNGFTARTLSRDGACYVERTPQKDHPPSVFVFLGSNLSLRSRILTRCVPNVVSTTAISPTFDLPSDGRVDAGLAGTGTGHGARGVEDVGVEFGDHLPWREAAQRAGGGLRAARALRELSRGVLKGHRPGLDFALDGLSSGTALVDVTALEQDVLSCQRWRGGVSRSSRAAQAARRVGVSKLLAAHP